MWAEVKSYISASSSFKKKIMLSGVVVKINFFSTSDTDGRGNYENMLFPAFLPPPQTGVTSSRSHQEYSTVLLE